ncbi:MAG: hypothetical protein VSS75_016635 [Candidatus Parabeggiatoa sp.]|nr:hypothetical protein [Candidatus Parabeggiatoa sp.]
MLYLQCPENILVQESGNIQTTQPLSQQLKQLSKSSSQVVVTNLLPVFAKTGSFKWICTFKKAQIITVNNNNGESYITI